MAVTSDSRLAAAPDIATFREVGLPSLSYTNWYGLFAPKGTPSAIVNKLKGTSNNDDFFVGSNAGAARR